MTQIYPQLENYLNRFYPFEPEELELIWPTFEYTELKKREIFIESGKPVTRMAFILEGVVAAGDFSLSKKNISYFVEQDHFFSEAVGLYEHEPADLTLKAITDCRLLTIDMEQIEQLDAQIFHLKPTFLAISVYELTQVVKMQNLRTKGDSHTRNNNFRKNHPTVYAALMKNEIAAFLNIAPSTFSGL